MENVKAEHQDEREEERKKDSVGDMINYHSGISRKRKDSRKRSEMKDLPTFFSKHKHFLKKSFITT